MNTDPEQKRITYAEFVQFFLVEPIPVEWVNYASKYGDRYQYHDLIIIDDLLMAFNTSDKSVVFERITFCKLEITEVKITEGVHFRDCRFSGDIWIHSSKISKIQFNRCVCIQSLSISHITQTSLSIFVQSTSVEGNTEFQDLPDLSSLNVSNKSELKGDVTISGVDSSLIFLKDSTFQSCQILGIVTYLEITKSTFTSMYTACSIRKLFVINDIDVSTQISFGQLAIELLDITKLKGSGNCIIANNQIKQIDLKDSTIATFSFREYSFSGILLFQNSTLGNLSFENLKSSATNAKFENISIIAGGTLIIKRADLGQIAFTKCNFGSGICVFEHSRLQDLFIPGTEFPRYVVDPDKNKTDYNQSQLFFGQLQSAYSKQGDNIRANEYGSREIQAYNKNLPWIKFTYSKCLGITYPAINTTRISLILNFISNDYGRNWALGIFFSFATGFIFFHFFLLTTFGYSFTLELNPGLIGPFLKFMNPLRHFEIESIFNQSRITFSPWGYFWDFLGRVFVAYGYYQTIQAFRRYGKK